MLCDWIEMVEKHAEDVGFDADEVDEAAAQRKEEEKKAEEQKKEQEQPAGVNGKLIRFARPPTVDGAKAPPPYDEHEDTRSPRKLDIEKIVKQDGLAIYKDQAGLLWSGLATYWTKRAEFDRRMDMISNAEPDDEDAAEMEKDLHQQIKDFEELMDRRPFLVNEVLLRRNPNDIQEWEKRITLYGESDEKVAETYTKALKTINPKKGTANYYLLYVNFARFYEEGGASKTAAPDMESARKVLERPQRNYDEAIHVMQRAAAVPKNTKINYHDQSLPVQARQFKSLKLWSYYVDLEESIGVVETTKAIYDKILELRIPNAQIIVNYAGFLEENKYFEETLKVHERGVELFTYPLAFEIWNIYLATSSLNGTVARSWNARDLFEQALEQCPQKHCKPLFLMYAQLEEEHGLATRSISILDRACHAVADEDKFEMYTVYIAQATANFGLPATRPIYEKAIEVLPNRQTA
ncbi:pre-mRNA-splicing factor syf1 [Tulasnella sp. 417]|nr:pre-mRNA-splicing factor syf1 [Tulasnella sp. 417]